MMNIQKLSSKESLRVKFKMVDALNCVQSSGLKETDFIAKLLSPTLEIMIRVVIRKFRLVHISLISFRQILK